MGELTAGQLAGWQSFFDLEPWGGLRDDLRAAQVVSAVFNAAPFRPRGSRPVVPADVFATLAAARPRGGPDPDRLNAFFRAIGGR